MGKAFDELSLPELFVLASCGKLPPLGSAKSFASIQEAVDAVCENALPPEEKIFVMPKLSKVDKNR